jgi:hypothetical protein
VIDLFALSDCSLVGCDTVVWKRLAIVTEEFAVCIFRVEFVVETKC